MPLCILPVLRNFYRQNKQSDIYILPGGIRVRIPQKLDVLAFRSWNLDVVAFWSWNPDVVYICLHGLVFFFIVKTEKPRKIF